VKERLQHLISRWVDVPYQRLHGKRHLPPWRLRFTVGSPADFEVTGAEFLAYLKLLCGLRSHHSIFDVGCGCGMMALQLEGYLAGDGRYVGMDIDRKAVAWCQAHVTTRSPRFSFYHADLKNPRYNPDGAFSAASYRFPEPDASFDVILLKSVFTHMQADGVQNYLDEIRRLLKSGARCLATFFLLNDEQASFTRRGHGALTFNHGDACARYADQALPEKAIAYRESYVLEMVERSALTLAAPPFYGTWSGRPNGLSFQDMLLLAKE
jgi:SAM-dependent methyltransferase